jgi:hypothetical protein
MKDKRARGSARGVVENFEIQNPRVTRVFKAYRSVGHMNMPKMLVDFVTRNDLHGEFVSASWKLVSKWIRGLQAIMLNFRRSVDFLARVADLDLKSSSKGRTFTIMGQNYASRTDIVWETPVLPQRLTTRPDKQAW